MSEDFAKYLVSKSYVAGDLISKLDLPNAQPTGQTLRRLWELTDLSASDFADEVARFHALPRMNLAQLMAAAALVGRFSRRFLREMVVFPYETAEGQFQLAVADPNDAAPVRAAEIVLGGRVGVAIASFEDIATVLAARIGDDDSALPEVSDAATAHGDDDIENLRDLASGAPIVRAVNDLLEKAMELRASDIHIEPFRNGLVVRMRVDGLLRAVAAPAGALPQALISRIKILSGLNIAERRLPQDGAARLRVARSEIDIRVATMPTQHGESAVVRLLPRDRGLLELAKLGLSEKDEGRMKHLLSLPHGMIVITGPTGSGKTTTLATMLSMLNQPTRKILTIEDPVEYELNGVNQSQVKPAIGLTFATALRAFVRQDPDVIMVGEIRDKETAALAVRAALTGHLVFSTIHTNTAAGAIPRLIDMGVDPFLIAPTLVAVIGQRLVRKLCEGAGEAFPITPSIKEFLDRDFADLPEKYRSKLPPFKQFYHAKPTADCPSGTRGRIGTFEILRMNKDLEQVVLKTPVEESVYAAARAGGMLTMREDAITKALAGVIPFEEVNTLGGELSPRETRLDGSG